MFFKYFIVLLSILILYCNYNFYGGSNNCNLPNNVLSLTSLFEKISFIKYHNSKIKSINNFLRTFKNDVMNEIQNYYDSTSITKSQLIDKINKIKNDNLENLFKINDIPQLPIQENIKKKCKPYIKLNYLIKYNYEIIFKKVPNIYNYKKIYIEKYFTNLIKIIQKTTFSRDTIDSDLYTFIPKIKITNHKLYEYFKIIKKDLLTNEQTSKFNIFNNPDVVACYAQHINTDIEGIFIADNKYTSTYNLFISNNYIYFKSPKNINFYIEKIIIFINSYTIHFNVTSINYDYNINCFKFQFSNQNILIMQSIKYNKILKDTLKEYIDTTIINTKNLLISLKNNLKIIFEDHPNGKKPSYLNVYYYMISISLYDKFFNKLFDKKITFFDNPFEYIKILKNNLSLFEKLHTNFNSNFYGLDTCAGKLNDYFQIINYSKLSSHIQRRLRNNKGQYKCNTIWLINEIIDFVNIEKIDNNLNIINQKYEHNVQYFNRFHKFISENFNNFDTYIEHYNLVDKQIKSKSNNIFYLLTINSVDLDKFDDFLKAINNTNNFYNILNSINKIVNFYETISYTMKKEDTGASTDEKISYYITNIFPYWQFPDHASIFAILQKEIVEANTAYTDTLANIVSNFIFDYIYRIFLLVLLCKKLKNIDISNINTSIIEPSLSNLNRKIEKLYFNFNSVKEIITFEETTTTESISSSIDPINFVNNKTYNLKLVDVIKDDNDLAFPEKINYGFHVGMSLDDIINPESYITKVKNIIFELEEPTNNNQNIKIVKSRSSGSLVQFREHNSLDFAYPTYTKTISNTDVIIRFLVNKTHKQYINYLMFPKEFYIGKKNIGYNKYRIKNLFNFKNEIKRNYGGSVFEIQPSSNFMNYMNKDENGGFNGYIHIELLQKNAFKNYTKTNYTSSLYNFLFSAATFYRYQLPIYYENINSFQDSWLSFKVNKVTLNKTNNKIDIIMNVEQSSSGVDFVSENWNPHSKKTYTLNDNQRFNYNVGDILKYYQSNPYASSYTTVAGDKRYLGLKYYPNNPTTLQLEISTHFYSRYDNRNKIHDELIKILGEYKTWTDTYNTNSYIDKVKIIDEANSLKTYNFTTLMKNKNETILIQRKSNPSNYANYTMFWPHQIPIYTE